jgi:peptidoglycan hydrolase CwlO-like protein
MYEEALALLKQLLYQQNYMNKRLDKIENKLDAVNYQTTDLTKFTTESELEIDKIQNDIDYDEEITSKNWNDIEI